MSAEDAIVELRRLVGASDGQYVMGILFDIAGAFDNVWWPLVLQALEARSCSKNIYRVMKNYFENRRVGIRWGVNEVFKAATRGCPQGSVLGPACWNLMFDGLLQSIEQKFGVNFVAFADDLIVVISGNSRRELEVKGQEIVDFIAGWCKSAKLELSKSKTEAIILRSTWARKAPIGRRGGSRPDRKRRQDKKATLDSRPPVIKLDGASIKFKSSVRYLGVHFDKNMGVKSHVAHIRERVGVIFNRLRRVAGTQWGLRNRALHTIYRGVFEPIVTYAASGWADLCSEHDLRALRSIQRCALLAVTCAYRTASWDSLCVIESVLPVDLLLEERVARYNLRKGREAKVSGTVITPAVDGSYASNKSRAFVAASEAWQAKFASSEKGRVTFAFFDDVRKRQCASWVRADYFTTQALTGHGQFGLYFKNRDLASSAECECGAAVDSVAHMVLECVEFDAQRKCINSIVQGLEWPQAAQALVSSEEAFGVFALYVRECLWLRAARARERECER